MTSGMKTVIYPVTDIAAANQFYSNLFGVAPVMDAAYYVGFAIDGQDVGLDPNGHSKGFTGPVGYWKGDDGGPPPTGNVAKDSSGFGNNGTYQGSATTSAFTWIARVISL